MSFWTKPSLPKSGAEWKGNSGFPSQYYFAVSFWLSFMLARQWFSRVELVTDKAGAEFVRKVGIPFNEISVELDEINHLRPELWAFGKMKTYAMQEESFLHLDYDVYLLKRPDAVFHSDIITQSPEAIHEWYYDERIKHFDNNFKNLPVEWHSFRQNFDRYAYNVGIIGGRNYKALKEYAEKGMKIIMDNIAHIDSLKDSGKVNDFNIVYEQYYLAAYMKHHGIKVNTLLPNFESRHNFRYEHFIGGAKHNIENSKKIESFLFKHFPKAYEKLFKIKSELN